MPNTIGTFIIMSYIAEQIAELAGVIYSGIGSPTSQSIGYVSGWLTSSSNLGDLNNRLNTSFSITGGAITGDFGDAEAAIYSMIYKVGFYETKASQTLLAGDSSLAWLTLKEGDSSVTREGSAVRAKAYMEMRDNLKQSLHVAVCNWKRGQSLVANVDSSSLYSWPTP